MFFGPSPYQYPPYPPFPPLSPYSPVEAYPLHASVDLPYDPVILDKPPDQPKEKRVRTNTPWTAAEETRLRQLREVGKGWPEIAKSFPQRTEGGVKKHWYKDMHHAEFDKQERKALLQAIQEYDANKWKVIGQKLGKPPKVGLPHCCTNNQACEQYAREHFDDG